MLVNQLTSVLLESANPKVQTDLTNQERLSIHLNATLPKIGHHKELKPDLSHPNALRYYTEGYTCIPFAFIDYVSDGFELGDLVEVGTSKLYDEFSEYNQDDQLMDSETIKELFQGYNNLPDSLILGVYFHSVIVNNKLKPPFVIERSTTHKFKPFKCRFTLKSLIFYDWVLWNLGLPKHLVQLESTDLESIEVIVKPAHGAESKRGSKKAKAKSDDEVSNVTVNVGAEEIER